MFINNWYAACIADRLDGTRRSESGCWIATFVLFRDSDGVARCLSDACCHRGASLSAGQCRERPASSARSTAGNSTARASARLIPAGTKTPTHPPKRARVPAYPTEEKYGLVFVFLGDLGEDERPALPDLMPEYDSGDWHHDVIDRKKDINYMRMSENYNDPCHVHYVHEFAKWLPKGVSIIEHEMTDTYIKAFHASWDADGNWSEEAGLLMEYSVIGCMSRNTNYQPNFPPQIVLATVTPIDKDNTQIFMTLMMPKDGEGFRARCMRN